LRAPRAIAYPGQVAVRPGRTGIPISVKLIVAASVIVAVVAGAVTGFAQHEIDAIAETQIALRRQAAELAIERTSELAVRAVAAALALPLATNAYAEIRPILDAALAEDHQLAESGSASTTTIGSSPAPPTPPTACPSCRRSTPGPARSPGCTART
jgi:hypothetical protein